MGVFDEKSINEMIKTKEDYEASKIRKEQEEKAKNELYEREMIKTWRIFEVALSELPAIAKKINKEPQIVYSKTINGRKKLLCKSRKLYGPLFYGREKSSSYIYNKEVVYADENGRAVIAQETSTKKGIYNTWISKRKFVYLSSQNIADWCRNSLLHYETPYKGESYLPHTLFYATFVFDNKHYNSEIEKVPRLLDRIISVRSEEQKKEMIKQYLKEHYLMSK